MKPYRSVLLIIFSAALSALSFPMANLWCFAWLAFIPLFIALKEKSLPNAFLLGFLWGLVFFYSTLYWLNSIALAATIGLVLYLSLYSALFAMSCRGLINQTPTSLPVFAKAVFLSSAWVVLEFIRANFLTGFGWASLGYSQSSFLPVIQIADIAGVYGISFFIMFVNVVIFEFLFDFGAKNNLSKNILQNRFLNLIFCIALIAPVFSYGFLHLRTPNPDTRTPVKISLIQGNIPQALKWDESYRQDIITKYFSLTKESVHENPDLIIWPESSFPADFQSEPGLANKLFELAKDIKTPVLAGANRFIWSDAGNYYKEIYNSAFLIAPDGKIEGHYDKLHLVPFGEFVPKVPKPLLKFLPEKINMVGDFTPGREYTIFDVGANGHSPLHAKFAVLICFEDVFPELSREFVKRGAQFLVNITNDGWYGVSSAPFQHAQASVFRAVENRVPVVRAANTGLSVFIDEFGRVVDSVKLNNGQEIFVTGFKVCSVLVPIKAPATFYNKYGDIFIIFCFLILIINFGIINFLKIYKCFKLRK